MVGPTTLHPIQQFRRLSGQVKIIAPTVRKSCIIAWPGRINFIIWACGFLVMLGLVIKDLSPLLDDYKNRNIATQLDIKTNPVPPRMTICLPSYSATAFNIKNNLKALAPKYLNGSVSMKVECETCELLMENGYDFWNKLPENIRLEQIDQHTQFLIDFVTSKLIADQYKPMINETNYKWVQFIVDILIDAFQILATGDRNLLINGAGYNSPLPVDHLDQLHEYLLNSIQFSIKGGCVLRKINDTAPGSETRHTLNLTTPVLLFGTRICFPAPVDQFGSEDFACSYTRLPYSWARFMQSVFEIYPDLNPLYGNVERKDALYSTDPEILHGSNESEQIKLRYQISSRLIAAKPDQHEACSEVTSLDACVAKRQFDEALARCGCVPFTYRHLASNSSDLPYCTNISPDCKEAMSRSARLNQELCLDKCEYTFYAWNVYKDIQYFKYDNEYPQYSVQIGHLKAPFVEFSFKTQTTPEQFAAQIGGLINLYIGGSGLTLFALLILGLEQIRRWLRVNQIHDQNDQINGWQLIRMVNIFRILGQQHLNQAKNTGEQSWETELQDLKSENEDLRNQMEEISKNNETMRNELNGIRKAIEKQTSKHHYLIPRPRLSSI